MAVIQRSLVARGLDGVLLVISDAHEGFRLKRENCRKGGTVLLFGVGRADHFARLPIFRIYHEEITVVGSFLNPFKNREALDLFIANRLRIEPLLARFPLVRFDEAVSKALVGEGLR